MLRPFCLEGSQQVWLKPLKLATNKFRRIIKEEDVDATVPFLDVLREGLAPILPKVSVVRV
jgi:hypothetical protein